MPRNSLKINSVLNMIRSLTKIIFPLITYKYVAGILQVENLGRYSFATSIVIYFTFISALGVNAYSIRTGVAYRDNKEQLEKFSHYVFDVDYAVIMGILEMKGSDRPCRKCEFTC